MQKWRITLIKDTKDMLHLPKNLRSKSGNYRFSIPGNPSLYLSNTSYGCWIETGNPDDNHFNVSPALLDGKQKILNLAVYTHNLLYLESLDNEEREKKLYCWLKLFMLNIATSYRIEESGRTFKSEYIISQAIMMACKRLGYDGLAYYSRRVSNINFALCAINLVLFVSYNGEYSELLNHIKIDKPTNFSLFNKLSLSQKYSNYELRIQQAHLIAGIGDHDNSILILKQIFIILINFYILIGKEKVIFLGESKNNVSINYLIVLNTRERKRSGKIK